MDLIPAARVARFEQIEPGDLFLYKDERDAFYALKTKASRNGDRSEMATLGPFTGEVKESFLLPWPAMTVLSLGKSFSILLPTEADAWSTTVSNPAPVWLAVVEETAFICTTWAQSGRRVPCFVKFETGEVVERQPPGLALFTNRWEIAVLGANHPPRRIVKYPSAEIE
jgi:hypothetical protein